MLPSGCFLVIETKKMKDEKFLCVHISFLKPDKYQALFANHQAGGRLVRGPKPEVENHCYRLYLNVWHVAVTVRER